jgi:hypothetical protein
VSSSVIATEIRSDVDELQYPFDLEAFFFSFRKQNNQLKFSLTKSINQAINQNGVPL